LHISNGELSNLVDDLACRDGAVRKHCLDNRLSARALQGSDQDNDPVNPNIWLVLAAVVAGISLFFIVRGLQTLRQRRVSLRRALGDVDALAYGVRADFVNLGVLRTLATAQGLPRLPDTVETERRTETKGGISLKIPVLGGLVERGGAEATKEVLDETGNVDGYLGSVLEALLAKRSLGAHMVRSSDVVAADQDRALEVLGGQGLSEQTLDQVRGELESVQAVNRIEEDASSLQLAAEQHKDVLIEGDWHISGSESQFVLELHTSGADVERLAVRVVVDARPTSGLSGLTLWGAGRLEAGRNGRLGAAALGSVASCERRADGSLLVALSPVAIYERVDRSEASAASARLSSARTVSHASVWAGITSLLLGTIGTVAAAGMGVNGIVQRSEACPGTDVGVVSYQIDDPSLYKSASGDASAEYRFGTCQMAFVGYCYGEPYTDSDGKVDDRWLVRRDGRVVPHSPGSSATVERLGVLNCRGGKKPMAKIIVQGKLGGEGTVAEFQISNNTAAFVGVVRQLDGGRWQRIARLGEGDGNSAVVSLGVAATTRTRFRAVACDSEEVPTKAAYSFTLVKTIEVLTSYDDALLEPPAATAEMAACAPT
jgi:hypothetical protein